MQPNEPNAVVFARLKFLAVGAALGFMLILAIAGGWYWYYIRSPKYSLFQARDAIQEHDLINFQKYVDEDSLTTQAVDDVVATMLETANRSQSPGSSLANGLIELMKPRFVSTLKTQIDSAVETGEIEKPGSGDRVTGAPFSMSPFWPGTQKNAPSFTAVEVVGTSGKISLVRVQLTIPNRTEPLTVDFKLRQRAGYWQVVNIANLRALIRSARDTPRP